MRTSMLCSICRAILLDAFAPIPGEGIGRASPLGATKLRAFRNHCLIVLSDHELNLHYVLIIYMSYV